MPRLLYLVNIPRFFVTHRLPLAHAVREAGFEVHVAAAGNDATHAQRIREEGFPFHPLPIQQHGINPLQELSSLLASAQVIRQLRPDIVHTFTIKPLLYVGLAAHFLRKPGLIFSLTGLGYLFSDRSRKAALLQQFIRLPLQLALQHSRSRLTFQNPDDRQRFIQLGLVAVQRTHLIRGSGVDVHRFQPRPEKDGTPVILFAGRLLLAKGIRDFVAVARKMREAGIDARFQIAGYPEAGNPDSVAEAQLTSWRNENIVELLGTVEDMPSLIANSHVVCLPSQYGEGIPSILLEAAASGRAIVTTDIAGCREIARDGVNALLIAPGQREALYDALLQLIQRPNWRRALGAQGREIATQEFAQERVFGETIQLYQEVLPTLPR